MLPCNKMWRLKSSFMVWTLVTSFWGSIITRPSVVTIKLWNQTFWIFFFKQLRCLWSEWASSLGFSTQWSWAMMLAADPLSPLSCVSGGLCGLGLSVQHTPRCSLRSRSGEFGGRVNTADSSSCFLNSWTSFCFEAGHAGKYIWLFRDFKSVIIPFGIGVVPSILLLCYPAEREHGHQGMSCQWKGEHAVICNNASVGGLCQGQCCIHVQFKPQIRSPGCDLCCSTRMMITVIPFGTFAHSWILFFFIRVAKLHSWKSKIF